jgi:Uma2 family endonuclease
MTSVVAASDIPFAQPRRLTRAEYERMAELGFFAGERVELIRGTVVRMVPVGPPHVDVVDRLNELLVPPLVGRARVRIQQPLLAVDESEPEPDVAVVARGSYDREHPDRAFLVIEVASSSLDYDRATKAPLYAASGIDEYWIVDVAGRTIEVFSEPAQERYGRVERHGPGSVLHVAAFPDVAVSLDALFSA